MKTLKLMLLPLATLLIAMQVGLAWGFDAPAVPADGPQAMGLAESLWKLIVDKNYALALGPGIALIVFALRKWDKNIPKVGPQIDAFLNQPFVAFLLPTLVSAAGGAGTAIAAHKPFVDVLGAVFEASMSAVFAYVGLKKAGEQRDAGVAAAAAVDTKTAAIEELKKP